MTEINYQPVDLVLNLERNALELQLPPNSKRLNTALTNLFSKLGHDIIGNIEKMREVITKIADVPSYHQSIKSVTIHRKIEKLGPAVNQPCTMANLEIFLIMEQTFKISDFKDCLRASVRKLIGLDNHLKQLQSNLIVSYDIECSALINQIKATLNFLPCIVRQFLGLTALENALERLNKRKEWQRQCEIPSLFRDQFPANGEAGRKKIHLSGDGGEGGHNMLNPKKTQDPKPKDDTTPFKTRPGRER